MLRLDGISKTYRVGTFGGRELAAVRDVSFEVRPGEVLSLIGESGAPYTRALLASVPQLHRKWDRAPSLVHQPAGEGG